MKKLNVLTFFSGAFIACAVIVAVLSATKGNFTCMIWAALAATYCGVSTYLHHLLNESYKLNGQLLETGLDLADKLQAARKTIEQLQEEIKKLKAEK